MGGNCVCNATTCPSGCCATGFCFTSEMNFDCGSGGVACANCTGGKNCKATAGVYTCQ